MNIAVIITKKAGFLVPEEAVRKVLTVQTFKNDKWMPSSSGMAIQMVEDGKKYLATETNGEVPSIEKFMEFQNEIKDFNAAFWFGSGSYAANDIQPFTLEYGDDAAEATILSCFIEGDFPKFVSKDNSEPLNLMEDIITATIQKYLEGKSEINYDELHAEFNQPLFQKYLEMATGHRGEFIFMLPEGEPIRIVKDNALGDSFDWGTMSQTMGYDAAPAEQKPTAGGELKKKFFSMISNNKAAPAAPTPTATPAPATPQPKKDKEPLVVASTKPIGKPSVDLKVGSMYRVPTQKNFANRQKWYVKLTGEPAPTWFKHDTQEVYIHDSMIKAESEAKQARIKKPDETSVKDFKDIQVAAAAANADKPTMTVKQSVTSAEEANSMVLSVEEKSRGMDFIIKHLDANSNIIAGSPLKMQEIEEKYPKFSSEMGIPLEDIFFYHPTKFVELCKEHPKLAAKLIVEVRRALMNTYDVKDLAKFAPKVEEKPVNTEVVNDRPTVPAETVKKPFKLKLGSRKAA